MTLQELKEIIDIQLKINKNRKNLTVAIPNNKTGGFGGASYTEVKTAVHGIDWNSGQFFIIPEKEMVEKENG